MEWKNEHKEREEGKVRRKNEKLVMNVERRERVVVVNE